MGKYVISAIKTIYMQTEVEAKSFEDAKYIYYNYLKDDDFEQQSPDYELVEIMDEVGERY